MINWNAVTVGKTQIINPVSRKFLVMARNDGRVWLENQTTGLDSVREEFDLDDWTIYDPWEDVSHECVISSAYDIYHNGKLLTIKDEVNGQYKRQKGPGLRVWKRKEG